VTFVQRALRTGVAGAVCLLLASDAAAREIIDRVLAVVGGQIITLSDARAIQVLGLLRPESGRDDTLAAVLERLIDRRLMLAEIDRYAPPEPAAAAIDAGVAEVRARFGDSLGFEIALNRTAMSHEELRRHVADTLRIDRYLQQRFGSIIEPDADGLMRYYEAHLEAFRTGGAVLPFEAVREEVRARVVEERRAALAEEWLDGLRRRGSIVVMYLPERGT